MANVKKILFGIGVNDYEYPIQSNGVMLTSYAKWKSMLQRCYSEKYVNRRKCYVGCSVCDEWLRFSNFKRWFDKNYVEGYYLDKDILVNGNKVYSPETCCFVPHEINELIETRKNKTNKFYQCVEISKNGKFRARIKRYGRREYLGTFNTPEEAFYAYKEAKEAYIKEVATKYYNDGKIARNVYEALMNYKVEITD
jgi:hypothetical protein